MIADALAVRWETLLTALGVLMLAVWAIRSPQPAAAERVEPLTRVELQVTRAGEAAEVVSVTDGCMLGRGRECTIVFDDASVSKSHARVHIDGGIATIEDLDSTNGTMLNGKRLEGKAALQRGDRIGLGTNQIVYLGAPPEGTA